MSVSEILSELPKLKAEERYLLLQRLGELEANEIDETPELLAALDEADNSPQQNDLSIKAVRENLTRWVPIK